jgi:hypothetical protein
MSNSQAITTSFKTEIMNGIHALGTSVVRGATTADSFKAALYVATATITAATTVYSATNEVSGAGYTAGGIAVTWVAPGNSGTTSFTTLSADAAFGTVTLATSFDCMFIYNTTQSNKSVMAVTFTAQTVAAAAFTVTMPANAVGTALLRIA